MEKGGGYELAPLVFPRRTRPGMPVYNQLGPAKVNGRLEFPDDG